MKNKLQIIFFILLCISMICFGSACFGKSDTHREVILQTDFDTSIIFETDPLYFFEDPEIFTEEEKDTPKETEEKSEKYVLNIRSKKIHKTTCGTGDLILPENREVYEGDIEDLYKMGYTQCGNCFK